MPVPALPLTASDPHPSARSPAHHAVTVNGQPLGSRDSANVSGGVWVSAAHAAGASPTRVLISTPLMAITAVHRKAYKPNEARDPLYGRWLDVHISLKAPLPLPVGGLLGPSYHAPAAAADGGRVAAASVSDGLLEASILQVA